MLVLLYYLLHIYGTTHESLHLHNAQLYIGYAQRNEWPQLVRTNYKFVYAFDN